MIYHACTRCNFPMTHSALLFPNNTTKLHVHFSYHTFMQIMNMHNLLCRKKPLNLHSSSSVLILSPVALVLPTEGNNLFLCTLTKSFQTPPLNLHLTFSTLSIWGYCYIAEEYFNYYNLRVISSNRIILCFFTFYRSCIHYIFLNNWMLL